MQSQLDLGMARVHEEARDNLTSNLFKWRPSSPCKPAKAYLFLHINHPSHVPAS